MSEESPAPAIDFGDLVHSEKFTANVLKLNNNIHETKKMLELASKCDFEKLSVKDQVVLDLYMAFAINALFWMYLRTKGIHSASHVIKSEINRVREYVARARKVHQRKQPTSRLNKDAAKRFIRSGLWKPAEKQSVADVFKKPQAGSASDIEASSSSNQINMRGDGTNQLKSQNAKTGHLGPPLMKKGKKTIFPD